MVKPIETRWRGCRFRSRLEARWAVFIDSLGLRWEHEPQGFMTSLGPYLPDFWLPSQRTWVEIKPQVDGWVDLNTDPAVRKLADVVGGEATTGLLIFGHPGDFLAFEANVSQGDGKVYWSASHSLIVLNKKEWGLTITGIDYTDDNLEFPTQPEILAARRTSLGARFEHGEMP